MIENTLALQEFVDTNDLEKDEFGRGDFHASVSLSSCGETVTSKTRARFSFANDFEERLVLAESSRLTAGEAPLTFKHQFGTWACDGATLVIQGKHPALGEYTVRVECE